MQVFPSISLLTTDNRHTLKHTQTHTHTHTHTLLQACVHAHMHTQTIPPPTSQHQSKSTHEAYHSLCRSRLRSIMANLIIRTAALGYHMLLIVTFCFWKPGGNPTQNTHTQTHMSYLQFTLHLKVQKHVFTKMSTHSST